MQYKSRLVDPTEWTQLLESTDSDYSLSQTYRFGEAIAGAYSEYSYEPRIFEFGDGTTMLLPLVRMKSRIRFLKCFEGMPFSLNGSPICVAGELSARHFAIAVRSLRADRISISTSALARTVWNEADLEALTVSERSTHILSLAGGFESVWTNRFAGKVRNQCRAAERRGVEIRVGKGAADFEAYYPIYMASVSRWGRDATSYPLGLFRALAKLAGKGVELKLAMVEGRVVGGVLLLHGRRNTLYWGSAMLKEYSRYSPMNAVLRSAIEEACEKRMEWFDFGASDKLDSVRTFKESFGALPRSYKNYALTTPRCRAIMQLRKALAAVV